MTCATSRANYTSLRAQASATRIATTTHKSVVSYSLALRPRCRRPSELILQYLYSWMYDIKCHKTIT
ncbi:hypothetical protein RR48_00717 [Papilio machaon]|uniref:Uncharacterized protein n=1 Tax=Papilio machaon TaxID=76193 RepID=A0A0N1IIA1_PAPMA|nr:hypothetical protein RR48_00717 [Papilio machaon]